MGSIAGHIIRFIVVILLQIVLINNLYLSVWCNPFIYIYFLLSLPNIMPRWADLLLGFLLGFVIDCFCNTLGMHTFASVLLAYLRQPIATLLVSEETKSNKVPSYTTFGTDNYIKYVLSLTLIHHTALFFLEAFSMAHCWKTILCILLSTIASAGVMLIAQLGRK